MPDTYSACDRAGPTTENPTALPARLCAEGATDLQHGEFKIGTDTARDVDPNDR